MKISPEEIFLYMNVTRLYSTETCEKYEVGDSLQFSVGLWICTLVAWAFTMLSTSMGPKSIKYMSVPTVVVPFIMLFAVLAVFVSANNSNGGNGIGFYFNTANFTLPLTEKATSIKNYDPSSVSNSILYDAYS
jgi:cytosine/uracil/thiamine/allantoin permease